MEFIFLMEKRQQALKKETFWLDVRGNIFTMASQAVEQATQKVLHSLFLKILKTRRNKTLEQPGLTLYLTLFWAV